MLGTFLNNACVGHEVVRHKDVPNKRVANDPDVGDKLGFTAQRQFNDRAPGLSRRGRSLLDTFTVFGNERDN